MPLTLGHGLMHLKGAFGTHFPVPLHIIDVLFFAGEISGFSHSIVKSSAQVMKHTDPCLPSRPPSEQLVGYLFIVRAPLSSAYGKGKNSSGGIQGYPSRVVVVVVVLVVVVLCTVLVVLVVLVVVDVVDVVSVASPEILTSAQLINSS